MASYQRELDVLSQQFSLKCLENGHLVQALDAERKALCQCQLENQELRTKSQVIHTQFINCWCAQGICRKSFSGSGSLVYLSDSDLL